MVILQLLKFCKRDSLYNLISTTYYFTFRMITTVKASNFEAVYLTGVCRNCRVLLSEMQEENELPVDKKSNDEKNLEFENLSFVGTKTSVRQSLYRCIGDYLIVLHKLR